MILVYGQSVKQNQLAAYSTPLHCCPTSTLETAATCAHMTCAPIRGVDVVAPQPHAGPPFDNLWTLDVAPLERNRTTNTGLIDCSVVLTDYGLWVGPVPQHLRTWPIPSHGSCILPGSTPP